MEQDLNASLIGLITAEMETEILINEDSSKFWANTREIIFETALTSFRESLGSMSEIIGKDKEAYNYFSSMVARVMSFPFARPALKAFVEGFDLTITDPVMGDGYNYKASELSPVGQLMLFISVNRNLITLAMFAKEQADAKAAAEAKGKKK